MKSTTDTTLEGEQSLMEPREGVNARELVALVQSDVYDWHAIGVPSSDLRRRRTRVCWWNDKQGDGTTSTSPYGTRPKSPWPGALDHEVRVVDGRCNEEVDLAMMTWFRSEKIVRPRDAMNDEQARRATAWRHAVEFYLDATKRQMLGCLELFANSVAENGKAVWFEGWEDRWRKGRKSVAWSELVAVETQRLMRMAQEDAAAQGGDGQISEEMAGRIEEVAYGSLEALRMSNGPSTILVQTMKAVDPLCPDDEAKRVIAEFRKDPAAQSVEYFAPVLETPMPVHQVFIPGVDCFYPAMSHVLAEPPRMAFVEWMSEAAIRVRSEQEGWDPVFTQEVLEKQRGMAFNLQAWGITTETPGELNGFDIGMQYHTQALRNAGLYQLIWLWSWGVGKDGLPAPYRTLLHPNITERVGLHECDPYGHGKMPWTLRTRDLKRKLVNSATAVADEMLTNQLGRKKLEDAMVSQSELRSNPPRLENAEGGSDGLRPGCTLPVSSRFLQSTGGRVLLDVPDISGGSVRMLEWLKAEENDFYLKGAEADPVLARARLVRTVGRWCAVYEDIIGLMCRNIQGKVTEIQLGSVAGAEVNWTIRGEDLDGELDVVVRCDEAGLDPEMAQAKLDSFFKYAAMADRSGQLEWGSITKKLVNLTFPDLGSTIMPAAVAEDKVKADQRQRIAQMGTNVPLNYDRPADAPEIRMQVLKEWASYPNTQAWIQSNEMLAQQVQREFDWFQFAIQQFQENPQTGRVGVKGELAVKG